MSFVTRNGEYSVAVQEYDEWIKKLPDGKKIRYSYQLLTTGYSASAEILEPVDATMVYTHTYIDLPAPADRAQIEAEFADERARAEMHRKGVYAPLGRYRSAS
jgi:hypothetical protein